MDLAQAATLCYEEINRKPKKHSAENLNVIVMGYFNQLYPRAEP
jgi:hypothetical protein